MKFQLKFKQDAIILDTGNVVMGYDFVETDTPEQLITFVMANTDSLNFDTDNLNSIIKDCDEEKLLEDWPNEVVVTLQANDTEIYIKGKLRHESCYSVASSVFFTDWEELSCDFGGDTSHLTFYLGSFEK